MLEIYVNINNKNRTKSEGAKYARIIKKCKSGGGHSQLAEGKKSGSQVVYINVIAHLLRNLEFVLKRSRTKCAMTGLNIQFLSLFGYCVIIWHVFIWILRYYVSKALGSFVKFFLPLLGKDMRMGNNNQYPPLPSLIREGVSNSHPELVSGFHKKLKHRVQSSVYKMLKQVQHDINLLKRTYSLINLFSYSPRKRCAFTLAEVLITLGVIGVVAAMTLPSLIADYKEKELVTRAKRSYSVIMNAINAYNADNESLGDNSTLMDYSKTSEEIITEFSKYFNGAVLCKQNGKQKCNLSYKIKLLEAQNDGKGKNRTYSMYSDAILLSDGSIVGLRRETTTSSSCYFEYTKCDTDADGNYIKNPDGSCQSSVHISNRCGRIMVDTNGNKGPNRFGSDVFTFQVLQNKITFMNSEGDLNYIVNYNKIQPYKDYTIGGDYGK